MALNVKYQSKRENVLRDVRPFGQRLAETMRKAEYSAIIFISGAAAIVLDQTIMLFADLIFLILFFYFIWLWKTPLKLPFKLPRTAHRKDPNNQKPGGGAQQADGILYFGNDRESGEEIWFTNNDARTHILYLGTTGSGKTEGLKSISANALCWSSGFLYIDGKADTDLWSTISAIARRFGRDDDLLIMNYMTGNVGGRVPSNTMNPFSSGSAGYLVNMLVSLMPDAEGDNAMWKERAVALVSSLMPCLVWKRDNQNLPISIATIRRYMGLGDIIALSRDKAVPEYLRAGVVGYLNELPGYIDDAFDDEGKEQPLPPDMPPFDGSVPRQQHGYLSMQFTRSLQSLGDDYGFIFNTQAADIDMMDVVLQRRIMITLIPALEKSSDETANLGKIIASTLKGMMGATLGSTVEGSSETAIENKPARSETPFIAIFDEVGYYAAQGMAVMAAQARSLGFCLVYAAQDLPAMEKRVKEEARSITANCNIKLFGKLEDPTQTKEFFEKTVGSSYVTEVSGYSRGKGGGGGYSDGGQASVQQRARADYDELRSFNEGRAICAFGPHVTEIQVYYANPGFAKAMRVQRFLPVPPPSEDILKGLQEVKGVLNRLRSRKWNPAEMNALKDDSADIASLVDGVRLANDDQAGAVSKSALAIASYADAHNYISIDDMEETDGDENQEKTITAAPIPQKEPETSIEKAFDADEGPMSWMDIIGGHGDSSTKTAENNKTENTNDLDNLFGQPNGAPPVPITSEDKNKSHAEMENPFASPPENPQEMSWANIIGIGADTAHDTDDTNTIADENAGTVAGAYSSAPGADQNPNDDFNMDDFFKSLEQDISDTDKIGDDSHDASSNAITTDAPAAKTDTKDNAQEDTGLSWADIIGGSNDGERDENNNNKPRD